MVSSPLMCTPGQGRRSSTGRWRGGQESGLVTSMGRGGAAQGTGEVGRRAALTPSMYSCGFSPTQGQYVLLQGRHSPAQQRAGSDQMASRLPTVEIRLHFRDAAAGRQGLHKAACDGRKWRGREVCYRCNNKLRLCAACTSPAAALLPLGCCAAAHPGKSGRLLTPAPT